MAAQVSENGSVNRLPVLIDSAMRSRPDASCKRLPTETGAGLKQKKEKADNCQPFRRITYPVLRYS